MLYGLETVSLRKRQESELEVAELKMLRCNAVERIPGILESEGTTTKGFAFILAMTPVINMVKTSCERGVVQFFNTTAPRMS
ncbi:hypothetical protein QTP86_027347 [Hemibagrus guttatus]|nr:hypothetical protein QTP86_027347 [Hemibagrus guttatus]